MSERRRSVLATQDSLILALSASPPRSSVQGSGLNLEDNPSDEDEQNPAALSQRGARSGSQSSHKAGAGEASETQPLLRPSVLPPPGVPKDRYYLAQAIFFLIGVGMLFPWNVFITATSFFELKFKGSPFFDNFERSAHFSSYFSRFPSWTVKIVCCLFSLSLHSHSHTSSQLVFHCLQHHQHPDTAVCDAHH